MTFASTAGLLSLFFVDLMDMYWLSLLGEIELAAAIGYAGSVLFFTLSISIGMSIGCGAVISQSIGEGDKRKTQSLIANILLMILALSLVVMLPVLLSVEVLLSWLGAEGKTLLLAKSYMVIVLPSMPLLGLAMAASGIMRAMGNAKEAMYLTLIGGGVNAVLDPIFIFGCGWGIEGAAIATACCRAAMIAYGYRLLSSRYALLAKPDLSLFIQHLRTYFQTAFPAMLTNLATPIGVAYVTATMAQFGDAAVAGNAIVGKIQPLAFAGLFALSGSVGPIAGQNLGAGLFDRISEVLTQSVVFILLYCLVACSLLFVSAEILVGAFKAEGEAASLIRWFCWGLSTMFIFNGFSFCTNALFNNLRVAHWATGINFARATIFTVPFAYFGAEWGGPVGIWIGVYIGAALVGMIGLVLAYWKIRNLPKSFA